MDLAGPAALEDRQRALAHVGEVAERLAAVEQRQVAADRARRLERVVHRGQLGVQQRLAAVAVHEPQVLVGGDVREVPRRAGSSAPSARSRPAASENGATMLERPAAGLGERFGDLGGDGDGHRRSYRTDP